MKTDIDDTNFVVKITWPVARTHAQNNKLSSTESCHRLRISTRPPPPSPFCYLFNRLFFGLKSTPSPPTPFVAANHCPTAANLLDGFVRVLLFLLFLSFALFCRSDLSPPLIITHLLFATTTTLSLIKSYTVAIPCFRNLVATFFFACSKPTVCVCVSTTIWSSPTFFSI